MSKQALSQGIIDIQKEEKWKDYQQQQKKVNNKSEEKKLKAWSG